MDTNTDESPGHQSQSQQLGNSPSEEEMGHWIPTGVEPKVYEDEDDTTKYRYVTYSHFQVLFLGETRLS